MSRCPCQDRKPNPAPSPWSFITDPAGVKWKIFVDEGPSGWTAGDSDTTRRDEGWIDPKLLVGLPGCAGEHEKFAGSETGRMSRRKFSELVRSMKAKGYLPGKPVQVVKGLDGRVCVWEGNHRLRAAIKAGVERVEVWFEYYGNSQRSGLIFDPKTGAMQVALRNPRPIPLPTKRLTALSRSLGKRFHARIEALGKSEVMGEYWDWMNRGLTPDVVSYKGTGYQDVRGESFELQVGIRLRGQTKPPGVVTGSSDGDNGRRREVTVAIPIDMGDDKAWRALLRNAAKPEWADEVILPTLVHEVTHAHDHHVARQTHGELIGEGGKAAYVNAPDEVRARMAEMAHWATGRRMEIVRALRSRKRPQHDVVEWILADNDMWPALEPLLTPENRRLVLQGVERALRDAGVDLEGKGMLPNPSSEDVVFESVSDEPRKWAFKNESWRDGRENKSQKRKRFGVFTMHWIPNKDGYHTIHTINERNEVVGDLFYGLQDERVPGIMEGAVEVHPQYRRRGIGSAMYEWAEELSGMKFAPAPKHTPLAEAMWSSKNRRFGMRNPARLEYRSGNHMHVQMNSPGLYGVWHDQLKDYVIRDTTFAKANEALDYMSGGEGEQLFLMHVGKLASATKQLRTMFAPPKGKKPKAKVMGKTFMGSQAAVAEDLAEQIIGSKADQIWGGTRLRSELDSENEIVEFEFPTYRIERFYGGGDANGVAISIDETPEGMLRVSRISIWSEKAPAQLAAAWPGIRDTAVKEGVQPNYSSQWGLSPKGRLSIDWDDRWAKGSAASFTRLVLQPVVSHLAGGRRGK